MSFYHMVCFVYNVQGQNAHNEVFPERTTCHQVWTRMIFTIFHNSNMAPRTCIKLILISFYHMFCFVYILRGQMHIGGFSWTYMMCSSWVSPGVDPNDIYNLPQNNMGCGTCIKLILMSFYHKFCFVYMFKGHCT